MVKRDLIHTNIIISCIHIVIVVSTSSWAINKRTWARVSEKHPCQVLRGHWYNMDTWKYKKQSSAYGPRSQKRAILYKRSLSMSVAPLPGFRGKESVRHAGVSRNIITRSFEGRRGRWLHLFWRVAIRGHMDDRLRWWWCRCRWMCQVHWDKQVRGIGSNNGLSTRTENARWKKM